MKNFILLIAFLAISLHTFGQRTNSVIDEADVTRIIQTLTADDMQGRGSFNPGIEKAGSFIESEFARAGLKPLPGYTSFRQPFTVYRITKQQVTAVINKRNISADSIAVATGASFAWINDPDVKVIKVGNDQSLIRQYLTGVRSGEKKLILVDPSLSTPFEHIRNHLLEANVSVKANANQALVFILGKFGSTNSFQVKYSCQSTSLHLFNVVGMLPGKTRPAEKVIFSAHYDHLGIIKALGQDSIANGADDDASGTTAVISLAKYYHYQHNTARTLLFVAFAAEELGEYGSQYFASQVDAAQITAMFNMEMIGKPSKLGKNAAWITGFDRSTLGAILQRNLGKADFKFFPDPYKDLDLFYRSDNLSLALKGVPAHSISTDELDKDELYHTVKDEFKTIDTGVITKVIETVARGAQSIITGKDTPTRVAALSEN